ncbi:MAG: HesA/MoeB/ThiF family protein [Flavobacteriaceae bacterium]|nr:HesA/MoeB/ThiF family protein [Flavobacteriaceae bacterium]
MNFSKEQLYQRQTCLQEFGAEGQKKLENARVLIIGCGGLGNAVAVYLAGSGVGSIRLIDDDVVSISNLHRQVFFTVNDIGRSKSEVLADHIRAINPFVTVLSKKVRLQKENCSEEFNETDLVVDCTDSLPTKYLINDVCVMNELPLVYGSLYKFDGYIASFNVKREGGYSANLRDAFPEPPKNPVPSCAEVGTLNPVVGLIALLQTNEVIKIITGIGEPLVNQLLVYNSLNNQQLKIKLHAKTDKKQIAALFSKESYFDVACEFQQQQLLLDADTLKENLNSDNFYLISVIEKAETLLPFHVHAKIPYSVFDPKKLEVEHNKKYIFVCNRGILSYSASLKMKELYPALQVFSLEKGIQGFNDEQDEE